MTSLHTFLESHRVKKGEEWNLTGIDSDVGSYYIPSEEY